MQKEKQKYWFFNFLGNQLFEEEHEQLWEEHKGHKHKLSSNKIVKRKK